MRNTAFLAACAMALWAGSFAQGYARQQAAPDRSAVIAAARDVMSKARYCSLVTLGDDGHPQARVVDPFSPDEAMTVWIGTRPATRKVAQIAKDPRVTLICFDPGSQGYVTLLGRAEVVSDPVEKERRWKDEWSAFYKDKNRGSDYVLIRVRPSRLEISSPAHGMANDPQTWRPVVIDLP